MHNHSSSKPNGGRIVRACCACNASVVAYFLVGPHAACSARCKVEVVHEMSLASTLRASEAPDGDVHHATAPRELTADVPDYLRPLLRDES